VVVGDRGTFPRIRCFVAIRKEDSIVLYARQAALLAASLAALLAWAALSAFGADPAPEKEEPKDPYADIDVTLLDETFEKLDKGTDEERKKTIEEVRKSSDKYPPPVFFSMSKILFEDGKKDDAAFCFYAGQLRTHYDANRCADPSAREVLNLLTDEYGAEINKYMFKDLAKLEKLIAKVVEWDRKTPHNYDPRWINLHGKEAQKEEPDDGEPEKKPTALSLPKEQWEAIAEQTRKGYLNAFKKVIADLKNGGKGGKIPGKAEPKGFAK
jgi:hypothetical protein